MGSKRQRLAQRRASSKNSPIKLLYVVVPSIVVVVVGLFIINLMSGSSGGSEDTSGMTFPSYAAAFPVSVKQAYSHAVESSDVLQYIPCFCGCGEHAGHISVHDCFVRREHINGGPVAFDDHGANCDMCVNIVLDAKRLTNQGKSIKDIRQYVTAQYSKIGPSTKTPPIP